MARSKSPARGKKKVAAAASSDVSEATVNAVVTALAMLAYLIVAKGVALNVGLVGAFFGLGATEHHVPYWPWGVILTGHVFNKCQGAGKGFWLGSIMASALSCFSGWLLLDVINCTRSRLLSDEAALSLVAVAWYLCNHDLPFTTVNVWSLVTGSPAAGVVQFLLSGCSKLFTAKLVIAACGAASKAGPLGFSVITPIAVGALVGSASEFYPLSKGLSAKSCSANMNNALNVAGITVLLPILVGHVAVLDTVVGPLTAFVGGNLVIAGVIADHLVGEHNPVRDWIGPDASKIRALVEKVLNV